MDYLDYHRKRFNLLTVIVKDMIRPTSILEVAPCEFTYNLRFDGRTHTLGYGSELTKHDNILRHTEYDLQKISSKETHPVIGKFQMVIASEIIEHLTVSMDLIFKFLSSYVEEGGYLLIQTPNAVALKKRLAMVFGNNPFDMVRKTPNDAMGHAHIREYTMKELVKIGTDNELKAEKKWCLNYFYYESPKARLYNIVSKILPSTLHDGITILLKKQTKELQAYYKKYNWDAALIKRHEQEIDRLK